MSHQRAEMLADQVGQLTARIAELEAQLNAESDAQALLREACEEAQADAREAYDALLTTTIKWGPEVGEAPKRKREAAIRRLESREWLREEPAP